MYVKKLKKKKNVRPKPYIKSALNLIAESRKIKKEFGQENKFMNVLLKNQQ